MGMTNHTGMWWCHGPYLGAQKCRFQNYAENQSPEINEFTFQMRDITQYFIADTGLVYLLKQKSPLIQ